MYHQTDPVAFALNATVDVEYSKMIKPIPIDSNNKTLLSNISERMSNLFSFAGLWNSSEKTSGDEDPKDAAEKGEEKEKGSATDGDSTPKKDKPVPVVQRARRPTQKRMPSERPGRAADELERVVRAEKRFKALNPYGCIDFYLPAVRRTFPERAALTRSLGRRA